jgi:hydroxyacylglutathione hydrolase
MKRLNRSGPPLLGPAPAPVRGDAKMLAALAGRTDVALIDTRPWDEFRAGHVPGALSMTLNKAFPTNAASYVTPETPIHLLVDEARLDEAVRDLVRVGLDRIESWIPTTYLEEYRQDGGPVRISEQIDVDEARDRLARNHAFLLDVRKETEFREGSLPGATNIAHTSLLARMDEIPRERDLLVFCQVGERSGYASALLERHGFRVAHLSGGFAALADRGVGLAR